MATYNGEKYIKEQMDSILCQLSEQDEVVVSDDASSDATISLLQSYNDPRIKIYHNNSRHPSFNFENALRHAKGEIIFLADQDDKWLDGKVSIMTNALKDADLVLSDCYIGDEDLNIVYDSFLKLYRCKTGWAKNIFKNSYLGCCIAFKSKILSKAMPFPLSSHLLHDYWLGLIGEFFFKPLIIKDKTLIYRRHDSNASPTTSLSNNTLGKKIMIRYVMLEGITKLVLKNFSGGGKN
jgi:glycosyltransferase involved in cell wall biosynthesis